MKAKSDYTTTLYNREWLVDHYGTKGMTATSIGLLVGCPTSTVVRRLRVMGFEIRSETRPAETRTCPNHADPKCKKEFVVGGRGGRSRAAVYCSRHCHMINQSPRATASSAPRPRKNTDTLHNEMWLREHYVDKRMGMSDIAALCSCTIPSVKWALEKFGIPLRTMSEAKFGRKIGQADRHVGDDYRSVRIRKSRENQQKLRREMVDSYGGKCECCGETELAFLTLDHKKGGGIKDRAESGGSVGVYLRLKSLGWPKDDYRCLCFNCNGATKFGRTCPHELKRQAAMVCVDPDTPS